MAYALAHKGKAMTLEVTYNPTDESKAYTSVSIHNMLSKYTSVARWCHGEDFDLATQPLDTDLLMRL
jgi:hypothetical protein